MIGPPLVAYTRRPSNSTDEFLFIASSDVSFSGSFSSLWKGTLLIAKVLKLEALFTATILQVLQIHL